MRLSIAIFFYLVASLTFGHQIKDDSVSNLMNKSSSTQRKIDSLNLASYSLKDSDTKRSFEYATQAYELALQSKNDIGVAHALINLGRYYTKLGRHETAMRNYLDALKIAQQQSDQKLIGLTYKAIGTDYYFKGDTKIALRYYKDALRVNEKIKDEETGADLQMNIGLVLIEPDQTGRVSPDRLDSALIYLLKSADTYKKLNKPSKLASVYINIGEAKSKSKQYDQAIEFYKKSLGLSRSLGLKLKEGYASCNIGLSMIQLGQFNEAEPFIETALSIARKENFRPLLVNVYESQYQLNKGKKKFAIALDYHEKLLKLKDSLLNEQTNNKVEELRTKYESEQKELENAVLQEESKLKAEQLKFTQYLLYVSIFFAVLVTALAWGYRRSLIQNKRAKDALIELNDTIENQKEELLMQTEELSKVNWEIASMNENLEKRVKEKTHQVLEQNKKIIEYAFYNSHLVRGPLARILGLAQLFKSGSVKSEEIDFLIVKVSAEAEELDTVIKEINKVLEENKSNLRAQN